MKYTYLERIAVPERPDQVGHANSHGNDFFSPATCPISWVLCKTFITGIIKVTVTIHQEFPFPFQVHSVHYPKSLYIYIYSFVYTNGYNYRRVYIYMLYCKFYRESIYIYKTTVIALHLDIYKLYIYKINTVYLLYPLHSNAICPF